MKDPVPILRFPVHPLLFAVAPVLFTYAHNVRQFPIPFSEIWLPAGIFLVLVLIIWGLIALLLRNLPRSALFASLFIVLFFLYGQLQTALHIQGPQHSWLVVGMLVVMLIVLRFILRSKRTFPDLTLALNIAGLAILLMNLLPVITRNGARPVRPDKSRAAETTAAEARLPDIYYLILDAYLRGDYLKANHNTDITGFLADLQQYGFRIISRARSNYRYTYASLASALNFTYLDSIADQQGRASTDMAPLIRMIQQNRVAEFLRHRGYRLVTFASGHTGTELAGADVRLAPAGELTEFQNLVLTRTMLSGIIELFSTSLADELHARRIRYTLRTLPSARTPSSPSFIFAHILSPHAPHVFDSTGTHPGKAAREAQRLRRAGILKQRNRQRAGGQKRISAYGQQVLYLNTLLQQTITSILADTTRPVIIIIQGDHGPILLPGQFAILNAIRLPPSVIRKPAPELYDSLTPVNTFRIILSTVFDTVIPLLPDRSYFCPLGAPYDFQLVEQPEETRLRSETPRTLRFQPASISKEQRLNDD